LHRLFNRLRELGFAQSVTLSMPFEQGVPLYYFDIGSPFLWHRTDGSRPELSRYSRGFSEDYDTALARVVGECLERTSLAYFRLEDMVRGSARALRSHSKRTDFIEPRRLAVFSSAQIEERPERRFDDDSVFRWTPGISLLTGKSALVPSQLVYWNYPPEWGGAPEAVLRERSSHGAGGFYSLEGAILSGLLECVQRDGFFLYWLRSLAPPKIDVSEVERPETRALIEKASQAGLETVLFDITSELGIPTCLCALIRRDGQAPYASMGGSCRLDGERAIHDAFLEAASVHHVLVQRTELFRLSSDYRPFSSTNLHTHNRIAFWANPEHSAHLEFFLKGETTSVAKFCRGLEPGRDARASLAKVVSVLKRHGMDAFYVEARHEALEELGYASVRVITPDLLPLYYEERNAPLGHPRLRTAPLYDGMNLELDFNWWPHPFP
jgi:ribosomal protein S12 methylthiotransferase accessory factor